MIKYPVFRNFSFMIRINRKDIAFLNFFLRFSAPDMPVLNAKNQLKFSFKELKFKLIKKTKVYFQANYKTKVNSRQNGNKKVYFQIYLHRKSYLKKSNSSRNYQPKIQICIFKHHFCRKIKKSYKFNLLFFKLVTLR